MFQHRVEINLVESNIKENLLDLFNLNHGFDVIKKKIDFVISCCDAINTV